jgi:hypothetical protein
MGPRIAAAVAVLAGCYESHIVTFGGDPDAAGVALDASFCRDPVPAEPGRTTVFVAADEPGADDAGCDGLAPTDEGGGRCPFRSLGGARVRRLLEGEGDGARAIAVVLRSGEYPLDRRLDIRGAGTRAGEAVVLAGWPGERAVVRGADLHTLLRLEGRWIRLEGLTLEGARQWNVTIVASQTCIAGNVLVGPSGPDGDSIRSTAPSGPLVVIRDNDFSGWRSQAVDGTGAYGWIVERNTFHDAEGGGVGFKLGARDVLVEDNEMRALGGTAFGTGTSAPHDSAFEAWNVVAERNVVRDVGGAAAQFVSCSGCAFRYNEVDRAAMAVTFPDQGPSGCPGGCRETTATEIRGNRFRDMRGDSRLPADTFVLADPAVVADFEAGDNVYCARDAAGRFWYGGDEVLSFAGWQRSTGTDASSRLLGEDAPECRTP